MVTLMRRIRQRLCVLGKDANVHKIEIKLEISACLFSADFVRRYSLTRHHRASWWDLPRARSSSAVCCKSDGDLLRNGFVVINTNDSRAHTIDLSSGLPPMTEALTKAGTTAPDDGTLGHRVIELNRANPGNANGIDDFGTIRGLAIH